MSRIVSRPIVTRFTAGAAPSRRRDSLAGEEPLEIRVDGQPVAVTMRTPGNDFELAAGFLVSEGLIASRSDFASATYCRGPEGSGENPYNVLNVHLGPEAEPPTDALDRNGYMNSSCGVCGKSSIESVQASSRYDLSSDDTVIPLGRLLEMPDRLRKEQEVFDRTGGLHAAALFDADTAEMLVAREDIGRHNAVDKVIGWALLEDRLPLRRHVLQVSARAGFELVQKAWLAGIPVFSAVSAPSSLAVELAREAGMTLAGFVRNPTLIGYSRPDRIDPEPGPDRETASAGIHTKHG